MLFQNSRKLQVENLKKFALDLGLDAGRFNTCLDQGTYAAQVRRDMLQGQSVGVSGTPAFFINGRFLSGAQPFSAFQEIIEELLSSQDGPKTEANP